METAIITRDEKTGVELYLENKRFVLVVTRDKYMGCVSDSWIGVETPEKSPLTCDPFISIISKRFEYIKVNDKHGLFGYASRDSFIDITKGIITQKIDKIRLPALSEMAPFLSDPNTGRAAVNFPELCRYDTMFIDRDEI